MNAKEKLDSAKTRFSVKQNESEKNQRPRYQIQILRLMSELIKEQCEHEDSGSATRKAR